ncbi:hypothetical protein D3C83_54190 [compost metagenome]
MRGEAAEEREVAAAAAEPGVVRVAQAFDHRLEAAAAVSQLVVRRPQVAGARELVGDVHAVEPVEVLGFVFVGDFVPQRPYSPVHVPLPRFAKAHCRAVSSSRPQ